jgi:type IV pilus assembly protein PilB
MEIDTQMKRTLEQLSTDGVSLKTVYHGTGCDKCRQTGYAGRVGLYELFTPDDEILDAVSRGASLQELRRMVIQGDSYITLARDGIEKVAAGVTTVAELLTATAL